MPSPAPPDLPSTPWFATLSALLPDCSTHRVATSPAPSPSLPDAARAAFESFTAAHFSPRFQQLLRSTFASKYRRDAPFPRGDDGLADPAAAALVRDFVAAGLGYPAEMLAVDMVENFDGDAEGLAEAFREGFGGDGVEEVEAFEVGDGEAMQGVMWAARWRGGEAVFVIFLPQ